MAENVEYMIAGYVAMALILGGLIFSIYWRYRMLLRDEQRIAQYESEEQVLASSAAPTAPVRDDAPPPAVAPDRSETVPGR
ncbi:MAG: hypothetical protein GYB65_18095 [Chloroflexi bacterium]|nr:hypothetical protein [Chloroflexota bacterium]